MTEDEAAARQSLQRVSDAEREKAAEQIRAAATDGRLGLDEIDERLGSALAARTRGELEAVLSDLDDGAAAPYAGRTDDVITVDGSNVQRVGRWTVPSRLVVKANMSKVLLDFAEATFTGQSCRLDVDLSMSTLRLVVPDDVLVDVAAVPRFSGIKSKVPDRPSDPRVVIRVEGTIHLGNLILQRPGRRRRRQLRKATPPDR